MKPLIISSLIVIAGLMLTGCQTSVSQPSTQIIPNNETVAQPSASPVSTTTKTTDDPEVKAVEDEFNKLDTSTDFPSFTEADLQK